MTTKEWLEMGVKNGVITDFIDSECKTFLELYREWFCIKMKMIKPQSVDRIEITYNKYYKDKAFTNLKVNHINESVVSTFLSEILITHGSMSHKEFGRLYQIVFNVLTYALDIYANGSILINWGLIKRYLPNRCIVDNKVKEFAINQQTIDILFKSVLIDNIYPLKKSACLCLLLNFYIGLRIGELSALKWSDIDYGSNVVRIFKTETKFYNRDADGTIINGMAYSVVEDCKTLYSIREIPLVKDAMNILAILKEHHRQCNYDDKPLCYDGRDSILSKTIDRSLRRLCDLCHIPKFNSHSIRKTFATRLHNFGMPSRSISDLLGHSEISTTEQSYIVSTNQGIEQLRISMSNALKGGLND